MYNAAGLNISLIPIEETSKIVREIEHHCLGQAEAELVATKNYGGKFSAEKNEQIIHNIFCDLYWLLCKFQVHWTILNLKLCFINMINKSYCDKSHWNGVKSSLLTKF